MAPLPEKAVSRSVHLSPRRWLPTLLGGALVASLTYGCASTKEYFSYAHKDDVSGDACQVVATWQNHVVTTTDTQHNGAPLKGIAGRVYLFGSEINYPMLGEGSVVVDLYDETQPHQAGAPVMPLEEWRIDKDTLKRLHKKDVIGECYTIFLPWATYKPEIARIQ